MRITGLCNRSSLVRALVAGAFVFGGGAAASASESKEGTFHVEALSADRAHVADHHDKNLVNPWGLARTAAGPWWMASNGTNTISVLDARGVAENFVVKVPEDPSGMVVNERDAFKVEVDHAEKPARFLIAAESGTISGWAPGLDQGPLTTSVAQSPVVRSPVVGLLADRVEFAMVVVDHSDAGTVYKGLAIADTNMGPRLYATDFHNNRVEMFDGKFAPVQLSSAFTDADIPAGYAPFGIRQMGGHIFVTYAKQDKEGMDDVAGLGNGYVDEYDLDGKLIARIGARGELDSPWGLAMAPRDYGPFSGDLLVGQFGSGRVLAYDLKTFKYAGMLKNGNDQPLKIDGLWAIDFGNGRRAGERDWLYFTAGQDDEAHGLFGYIEENGRGS